MGELLRITKAGLYCADGDFYIDPWRPVDRAVVTHAHSDHARPGMRRYLCSTESESVLRLRVGQRADIQALNYGERLDINGVRLSLHPAGHILGSAQVRVERAGEVIAVSGDYKTAPETTCTPFEPVKCHTFVTESTFGLPIYRWPADREVFDDINRWWRDNCAKGIASIVTGYSLGKAQRALSGLDRSNGPIFMQETIEPYTDAYRRAGIDLPDALVLERCKETRDWSRSMIVATPNISSASWLARIGPYSIAFLSGWMAIGSMRRRTSIDRGFVLSDHVDWPSLLEAIHQTEAQRVLVTHGYCSQVVRYLREQGLDAHELETAWSSQSEGSGPFGGEDVGQVGNEW
ncbi:MAG: ligase-associated DNA damage response exonuclease [Fimbriimonas sp.]|nr:ligase-associated DNA damage response exonuclease [Fimbriimonas sp.]